jgi:hypothetical protein
VAVGIALGVGRAPDLREFFVREGALAALTEKSKKMNTPSLSSLPKTLSASYEERALARPTTSKSGCPAFENGDR